MRFIHNTTRTCAAFSGESISGSVGRLDSGEVAIRVVTGVQLPPNLVSGGGAARGPVAGLPAVKQDRERVAERGWACDDESVGLEIEKQFAV